MTSRKPPAAPAIYDGQGRPVPLGPRLGRGGEGAVYALAGDAKLVAKVYHKPVAPERAEKLREMVRLQTAPLAQVAAWPLDTVHLKPGGGVSGVVMPRVTGEEIHELYSPKSRLTAFPNATWKFLVHAAANLSRAFAVVHEHGHLVGDVNHGNVLVSPQATVRLIDCDSFQVQAGGRQYLCEVGVSTHVPPELQGGSLRVARTEDHDAFGLAVLIFQILFMGRHPFSGHYLGAGDMPIEKAIREHRFAYGPGAASRQMRQPPNTLELAAASIPVAALFEQAFSAQAAGGAPRPRAREWVAALDAVRTTVCGRNSAHLYLEGLPACPWCALEGRAGTVFFHLAVLQARGATGAAFDLAAVWAQIKAVPSPGPAPAAPEPKGFAAGPSPAALEAARAKRRREWIAILVATAGITASLFLTGCSIAGGIAVSLVLAYQIGKAAGAAARSDADLRLKSSMDAWIRLRGDWAKQAGDDPFRTKLAELDRLRSAHHGLPALRAQRLAALEANRRQDQLERFLDRHRIDRAKIPGIGDGRKATLQSYGIETAADVKKQDVLQVPGFGPVLTDALLAWRRALESKFVFDPAKGVDPADVAALDRDLAARRGQIERSLLAGRGELEKIRHQVAVRRQGLWPQLAAAAQAAAQAEADLRALGILR